MDVPGVEVNPRHVVGDLRLEVQHAIIGRNRLGLKSKLRANLRFTKRDISNNDREFSRRIIIRLPSKLFGRNGELCLGVRSDERTCRRCTESPGSPL